MANVDETLLSIALAVEQFPNERIAVTLLINGGFLSGYVASSEEFFHQASGLGDALLQTSRKIRAEIAAETAEAEDGPAPPVGPFIHLMGVRFWRGDEGTKQPFAPQGNAATVRIDLRHVTGFWLGELAFDQRDAAAPSS